MAERRAGMSRAGRRRAVLAKREANGDVRRLSKPEQRDKIMGVVLSQPHRLGETSHLAGFVLGRLLLTKQINADQFQAGERYGQLVARHMRDVLGVSYRWPAASIASRIGGRDVGADPDPELVIEIERQWSDAMNCLAEYGLLRTGVAALARICLMDLEPYGSEDLGNARQALNVLHRIWSVEPKRRH
jgi:hypothetical protein